MRLPRPHVPLSVRVQVAERQMLALTDCECTDEHGIPLRAAGASLASRLKAALFHLSSGGTVKLHLDHDPALGAREKIVRRGAIIGYRPDANDPEHLFYRDAESHKLKTNVRGDGAQYPDRVLIKRQRRRENVEKPRRKVAAAGRWQRRTLAGAKGWPPRGSRKLTGRAKP